jgi:hypothetical protein
MAMSWNNILSLLVGASAIAPIYIQDGFAKIKLQPTFRSGEIGSGEFYSLNMCSQATEMGSGEYSILSRTLSFFGGSGNSIVGTAEMNAISFPFGVSNSLGIGPESGIYRNFENGLMLVPGRLGNDFPQDTQMSLVFNPENPEVFCEENSLFYMNIAPGDSLFKLSVEPKFFESDDQIPESNNEYQVYTVDTREKYDQIPYNVYLELYRRVTSGNPNPQSTYIINDCYDLDTFPSILFRIGDRIDGQFNHRGDIIYSPDDYLESVGENQCNLKVRGGITGVFGLNFFSRIAAHLNRDRIGFCDP